MLPQFCLALTRDHKPVAAVAPRLVGDEYRMPVGWRRRGQVNGEIGGDSQGTIGTLGKRD